MDPIQFVVEDKQKQGLEEFATASILFLASNPAYEEVVRLANSITELKGDHITRPESIQTLPEGFYYRFSGFYGQVIGVVRDKSFSYQGKRIELILMPKDPRPVPPGTRGTCEMVDGVGQLVVKWDNGSTLSLIPGVDKFKVLEVECPIMGDCEIYCEGDQRRCTWVDHDTYTDCEYYRTRR